ncbi:MAG TPA: phage tail protein [Gemmatimonadales bacterium]|nr:phage tail protein [Gemmatimonadales bacterium]
MDMLPTARFLNLELAWPRFQLDRLEIGPEGELRLAQLPHLDAGESVDPAVSAGLTGPAGVGVDSCGHLYVADTASHRILRVDSCDGSVAPLACIRGPGDAPGFLDTPRGVLVGRRDVLYVADAGNHRVQLFDLHTGGLRGIWDRGFEQPWDLAQDGRGRVYVADPGRRAGEAWTGGKVTRFERGGGLDGAWELEEPVPGAPTSVAIAVLPDDAEERLLVLDCQPARLLVYRLDGTWDEAASTRWSTVAEVAQIPSSLAVTRDGVVHLADLASGQVFTFAATGRFLGVARGLQASAAGIGLDCRGRLAATPGGGKIRQSLGQPAFVGCGTFLAGPFDAATEPTRWQRFHLDLDPLPEGAHLKLWTLTSNQPDDPGMPVDCAGNVTGDILESNATRLAHRRDLPAQFGEWRELPWDSADGMILNEPATWLWIAGMVIGNGLSTPTLRQAQLVHDDEGWLRHLPALYSRDETSRQFLERALGLFETLFNRERDLVDDLPRLFDPWASPDESGSAWLEWLADWVGTELDEGWDGARRRATVANAFRAHGVRGTRASLQRLVALYADASVVIDEAAAGPGLWGLGTAGSGLGFDTALAPVPPGGAVLGSSAVVNHSTIESEDPRGGPAFGIGSHCFTARVYAAEASSGEALDRVRKILDREKPAHTSYHLCRIEPTMRVGLQAVVGIDTIVAGPSSGAPAVPPSVPATVM